MSKPTPIAEVLRRIRVLPDIHKIAHLRGVIACEPRRSIRRHELEIELRKIVNKRLRKENRLSA